MASGNHAAAVSAAENLLNGGAGEPISAALASATDVALLVDTAAAYYQRYASRHRAEDLLLSTTAAVRAHRLAPHSLEVLWNRALTIESVGLVGEARAAWTEYLHADGESSWATEAREHLARLDAIDRAESWPEIGRALEQALESGDADRIAATATRHPVLAQSLAERLWIPRWATAVGANDDLGAARLMRGINAAGAAIAKRSHDGMVQAFASTAVGTSDRKRFAAPHAALLGVRDTIRRGGTIEAAEDLTKILRELRIVRSPIASAVAVELATLQFHASQYKGVLETLSDARDLIDEKHSPITAARAAWNRGVSLTALGHVEAAARSYARALELFRGAGDRTQAGPVQMLFADNAELAGNLDESWSRYLLAISEAERFGEPDRVVLVLDTFCRAALRRELSGFAEFLNDVLVDRAREPHLAPYLTHALVTRCDMEARRKNFAAAHEQCVAARQAWSSITDRTVRERLEADLEIATAAASEHETRLAALNRAVDVSNDRGDLYRLSRVLLLRARAYVRTGAVRLAEEDFERSLVSLEQQRQRLELVPDRLTYFDTSESVAEELVRLLVEQERHEDALAVVDRVRARALLDRMMRTTTATPLPISEIRRTIQADEALAVYWCGPAETYVWIVRRHGITFRRQVVRRPVLQDAARRLLASMDADNVAGHDERASETLFQHLVAPVLSDLHGVSVATIVPAPTFADIPFAVLRDSATKGYLVERLALKRSASASAFAATPRTSASTSVLVVANPDAPDLPRLDVTSEIRAAVRAIPHAAVYLGAEATKDVLTARAHDFEAIHIAAHGFDDTGLGEPTLALTPKDDDGFLTATDVEALHLDRGSLVVLAGCRTARGRHSSEGTLSMARAFLMAGAGSVTAALWDVPDAESSLLFAHFYRALSTGATPAQALRTAQVAMIRSGAVHPQSWAAYQIHGGA